MRIAFRCDGDARVGAGHVARSIQLAEAFVRAGHEALFVGRYDGLAGGLLRAAGLDARPPEQGLCGVPAQWAAPVMVDSYSIPSPELERLALAVPVGAFCDGLDAPRVTAVLHPHLSPPESLRLPAGTTALVGPDYAPVSPRFAAARRGRGLTHALVTVGGSEHARRLVEPARTALGALGDPEVFVSGLEPGRDVGLLERIEWADVAISAAGGTAYELACAGVPTVVVVVADNQAAVGEGLARAGAARALDARSADAGELLHAEVAALASAEERARLAIAGPETVDGHGAARARDALLAAFAGDELPRVLRYRPARSADARQLLAWRNDPEVRGASRSTEAIDATTHERWLKAALSRRDLALWIAVENEQPVGSLRFDRREAATAEISVSIAAERRGQGVGVQAIREATELYLAAHPEVRSVLAEIRPENSGSIQAFERGGYRARPSSSGPLRVLEATASAAVRSSPR